jgi:hypothetical protein
MRRSLLGLLVATLLAASAAAQAPEGAEPARASAVPELPFDDNPDPDQCGIPQPLGDGVAGLVTGVWQGELLFEHVHLYDSHLRSAVTGTVPNGAEVRLVMFQDNPVLNYWLVRWDGPDGRVEGWLPDPFLRRD